MKFNTRRQSRRRQAAVLTEIAVKALCDTSRGFALDEPSTRLSGELVTARAAAATTLLRHARSLR